jgi:predicted RND superfamily exporter protein
MLLTTMNLIITFYAIITITFAIICTVASIVLLGWDLNIIESITISLAVGLSIDFTIHYGVAYRLSCTKEPRSRVNESFSRVGSAVAMAALTTFAAGIAMMPARVIAYTKLGTFLMLVMTFSWVYATFLFQSICRIIGPRGNFCQITFTKCKKTPDDHRRLVVDEDDDDDSLITFS